LAANKSAKVTGKQEKSKKAFDRRFCIAPMMESKNSEQKTLLFGYLARFSLD